MEGQPTNTEECLHNFRKEIDACIQKSKAFQESKPKFGREMALVHTKLQEAKMWAGKCLEVLGSPFPPELADKAEVK